MSENDKNEVKTFRNQIMIAMVIGMIGFLGTSLIVTRVNNAEIETIKKVNYTQDEKIDYLQKETVTKQDFKQMFEVLRQDIRDLKTDIQKKQDKE